MSNKTIETGETIVKSKEDQGWEIAEGSVNLCSKVTRTVKGATTLTDSTRTTDGNESVTTMTTTDGMTHDSQVSHAINNNTIVMKDKSLNPMKVIAVPVPLDTSPVTPARNGALSSCVLKFRGLPYSATEEDLRKFLNGYAISEAERSIVIINQGFRKGEAFALMETPEVAQAAKAALNRADIGSRYVEIYSSSAAAMATAAEDLARIVNNTNLILRIRGLPYNSTKEEILEIFDDIPNDKIVAVDIIVTSEGRMTGVAFVEISDMSLCDKAAAHDHARVGHRYVEITVSTANDRDRVVCSNRYATRNKNQYQMLPRVPMMFTPPLMPISMMNPMMMGAIMNPLMAGMCNPMAMRCSTAAIQGKGAPDRHISDYVIRLHGLPSDVTEDDVGMFLNGVTITRHGVHLVYSEDDQLTGEAYVELSSKNDVTAAMKYNGKSLRNCAVKVLKSSKEDLRCVSGPEPVSVPMPMPMPIPMINPMMISPMPMGGAMGVWN